MFLREIGYEVGDWIHLAQNTVQEQGHVNTVLNPQFLYKVVGN